MGVLLGRRGGYDKSEKLPEGLSDQLAPPQFFFLLKRPVVYGLFPRWTCEYVIHTIDVCSIVYIPGVLMVFQYFLIK